jgi:hypothetical protein
MVVVAFMYMDLILGVCGGGRGATAPWLFASQQLVSERGCFLSGSNDRRREVTN